MKKDLILAGLYEAALELDRRALWRRFTNFDSFAVEAPGEDSPMFVTILGNGGEEYGLNVLRGPRGLATLRAMHTADDPDLFEEMDVLGFNMDPAASLEPDSRKMARRAGAKPSSDGLLPDWLAKRPGMKPRRPNRQEQKVLLYVICGILCATEAGQLKPEGWPPRGGIATVSVTGDPNDPEVSVTRKPLDDAEPAEKIIAMGPSTRRLDHLPLLDESWLAGLLPIPGFFEDDERSFELLLVHDQQRDAPAVAEMVPAGEMSEAVEHLLGAFEGGDGKRPAGVPREIVFTSRRLHEAAAPLLEAAGAQCRLEPMPEELHQSFREITMRLAGNDEDSDMVWGPELARALEGLVDPDGDVGMDEDWDDDGLYTDEEEPAPPAGADDLAGWQAADDRVTTLFDDVLLVSGLSVWEEAVVRYFGEEELGGRLFDEFGEYGIEGIYADWAALSYRPGGRGKTLAEVMIAEGMPEAEEAVLKARMGSHPTLCRVIRCDGRAGTVTIEDALCGGGEVTVHDDFLAENAESGHVFPGRVYPAGEFHFVTIIGPAMDEAVGAKAVEYLAELGLEFTPDRLREDAHLFGRLWGWAADNLEIDSGLDDSPYDDGRLLLPVLEDRSPQAPRRPRLRADDVVLPYDDTPFEDGPFGTYVREKPKVGRNDPCPCGSGRKYKKCCGRAEG